MYLLKKQICPLLFFLVSIAIDISFSNKRSNGRKSGEIVLILY